MASFAAIDFETADHGPDSACAVGVAVVRDGRIVERVYRLIRPPRPDIRFTPIHGLTWRELRRAAVFAEVWGDIAPHLEDSPYLVAHNAGFDRAVLRACCAAAGLPVPSQPFLCTLRMARETWDVRPTRLPDVCRFLAIALDHHHAGSDAAACAEIAIAAFADGYVPDAPRPVASRSPGRGSAGRCRPAPGA